MESRRRRMLASTMAVACLAMPQWVGAVVNPWTPIGPPGRHALTADAHSIAQSVTVDPNDSRIVYAATTQGVFRSRDGGATWTLVYDLFRAFRIVVDPTDSRRVYAAGESGPSGSGIVVSTDGGDTWATTSFAAAAYELVIDPG